MLESLIRRGDFCWHCHVGIAAYPVNVAIEKKVPLIFYGEPSAEYSAYTIITMNLKKAMLSTLIKLLIWE